MATEDPYYDRKPVPDSFIKDIGETGLTKEEEYLTRENKYKAASKSGKDVRRFWNPTSRKLSGKQDPYYQRKQVPKELLEGVGVTGLSPAEEYATRERKYSLPDGSDARRFAKGKGGFNDTYYSRKPVSDAEIVGVGDTGNTEAEDYAVRERKQSMFQLSSDPFAVVTGQGHRQSISGPGLTEVAVAAYRRKSSAVAPDAVQTAMKAGHHHSGYDGPSLAPIESKPDFPGNVEGTLGSDQAESSTNGVKPATQDRAIQEYDDPDSVAPHEVR